LWHAHAKFCPLCGKPLAGALVDRRERLRCTGCEFVLYTNPACAAAALVLDERGRVLLIRRRIAPFLGDWALPAGYQEIDEDPRDTARREAREETGLEIEVTGLFDVIFVQDDPRKPANVVVFYCRPVRGELTPGSDASDVRWFDLDGLPENVGFDNARLILDRLTRGRPLP